MTARRSRLLGWFIPCLLALPQVAHAEGYVDQVERLEIEAGEAEVEGQFIHAWDDADGDLLKAGLTVEYGLSDSLQLGIEIETARPQGASLEVETIGLQAKWSWLDPQNNPLGLGLQSGLTLDPDSGNVGSESFFIAEHQGEAIDLAANIILETEPGEWGDPEIGYALRAERALGETLALAIEAGGGLAGEGKVAHFLGPVLVFAPAGEEGPAFELSLFAPLSSEAPDLQARLEVDFVL